LFFARYFELYSVLGKLNLKKTSTKNLIKFLVNNYILNVLNLYLENVKLEIKVQNLNTKFKNEFLKKRSSIRKYKKTVKDLKKFVRRDKNNKNFIKSVLISVYEINSAKLLAKSIATILEKVKKKQFFFLFLLKTVIKNNLKTKYSSVKGVKVVVTGRFNKRPRARKFLIQVGQISLHSVKSKINYHSDTAFTSYGTFGVKTWICY
jgi:ribosomal protein S3